LLIIAGISPSPLTSDVLTSGAVVADNVVLAIGVRFKNPNITVVPSIPSAVTIERYEIKYRRSDGRGVEGQDVPFSISGNVTSAFDVKLSGTDPLVIEAVRAQAKLEPPLRNLRSTNGGTSLGGAFIVTMFADITLHGRTISGQTVTATGTLQIDFADISN
ncbi:MAG: hypothetical protein JJE39_08750, partial [Vicinamibacteria bacterium]|nr:hypothetical protein [Vicinamibacteria bacterium]